MKNLVAFLEEKEVAVVTVGDGLSVIVIANIYMVP